MIPQFLKIFDSSIELVFDYFLKLDENISDLALLFNWKELDKLGNFIHKNNEITMFIE